MVLLGMVGPKMQSELLRLSCDDLEYILLPKGLLSGGFFCSPSSHYLDLKFLLKYTKVSVSRAIVQAICVFHIVFTTSENSAQFHG